MQPIIFKQVSLEPEWITMTNKTMSSGSSKKFGSTGAHQKDSYNI